VNRSSADKPHRQISRRDLILALKVR